MHSAVEVRREVRRGCGWRRPGLYLMADGVAGPCGKLPIRLERCPCCNGGIKPTRGWTWVDGTALSAASTCRAESMGSACGPCPLRESPGRVGLLWIGEKFYHEPINWTTEALRMGVSRRIPAVPREFKLGETWVWVAHRRAILEGTDEHPVYVPGVFHAFKPSRIEVVLHGDEGDDLIDAMVRRGLTPVIVERVGDTPDLPGLDEAATLATAGAAAD